jgi:hypothetical protein
VGLIGRFSALRAYTPAVLRSADVYLTYFAIVARMTAKLKMNPVSAMNLESS